MAHEHTHRHIHPLTLKGVYANEYVENKQTKL